MRALEPANRVRIGLMGILVMLLVIGVGQSFTSVPMLFAKPSYYGAVHRRRRAQHGRQGAHRRHGRRQGAGTQDRRRPHRGQVLASAPTPSAPRAGWRSAPTPSSAGRSWRSKRGATSRCAPGQLAAGPNHHSLPDLRRVLRRHQGRRRLGHRHRQAIAARVVGDRRSDLPAPERRARRGGEVLRHRSANATRRSQHLLAQANKVASILGDRSEQINRLLVNAQDAAGRDQRARPGHRRIAEQRRRVLRAGARG